MREHAHLKDQSTQCGSPILKISKERNSPVPRIVYSNSIPTLAESQAIQETLRTTDADIAELDTEISRVQSILERLQDQRQSLHEFRTSHSALLSPIRRLAPELLSEIFRHCLPCPYLSPHSHSVPLLLAQICYLWRQVALSTPALWSSLFLNLDFANRGMAALVPIWLSRSGALPISLCVVGECDRGRDINPVLASITPFSDRWATVTFNLPASIIMSLTQLGLHSLPTLQHLELGSFPDSGVSIHQAFDAFALAPKLQSLRTDIGFQALHVPWQQLTSIFLARWSTIQCLRTIDLMPSLVSCTIEDPLDDMPAPFICIISDLASLHLEDISSELAAKIFSSLTLPKLLELTIQYSHGIWPRDEFLSLMSRSHFKLRSLALRRSMEPAYDDFVRCLREMQTLEELEMCWVEYKGGVPCVSDHFLTDLTHTSPIPNAAMDADQESLLLPNLQVIKLCGPLAVRDSVLVDMVESRWNIGPHDKMTRLRFVGLKYHREWDAVEIRRLKEFGRQGLEVVLEQVPATMRHFVPAGW
jgi:hypothetical protein